jgi:hypothetical protein
LYKKTIQSKAKKTTRTGISQKIYATEIKELNQRLKEYDIKDTKLTVMQDTTDLKSDILKINFNKSELSQKMFQFKAEKLALNTYDNKGLLAEIKFCFRVIIFHWAIILLMKIRIVVKQYPC